MTQFVDEHDFDQYDIASALEDSDPYDVLQGIGHAGEETLRSIGNLVGDNTGEQIANSVIDAIHYAAQSTAQAVEESGLIDTITGWFDL